MRDRVCASAVCQAGQSALHLAAYHGNKEMVKFLVEHDFSLCDKTNVRCKHARRRSLGARFAPAASTDAIAEDHAGNGSTAFLLP